MAAEKATALVVRGTDWSETSRITTLFTREFGKVRALAKGGRRLRSNFEIAFDLLTVCDVVYLRKAHGGLDLLTEARVVERFPTADALCCWVGLTPKHRESDVKARRGRISKQGSRLLRWSLIEGTARYHGGPTMAHTYRRIAERRGKNKANIAIARRVLTLVYYGLRDGEIRCLAPAKAA